MPINLFISFAHEDLEQLESFRALAKNPEHELEFHDRSELEPVRDKVGTPLPYPPNDKRAEPVREEIKGLLEKVLLGCGWWDYLNSSLSIRTVV